MPLIVISAARPLSVIWYIRTPSETDVAPTFVCSLGRGGSLSAELPAGIDETVQDFVTAKDEDNAELLHAEPESCLQLNHLHEGFFLRLVVDSDAFAFPRTREQDLYSRIAKDNVACAICNCGLGRRLGWR